MSTLTDRWLDVLALAAFLGYVGWISLRGLKHNETTERYFLGGREFPGWAVALSMIGTSLSSITFLALPAAAYALDYRMIAPNLMLPIVAVAAAIWLVPMYRRDVKVSAFEYLERRFNPAIRLYAASTFLVIHLIRIATVLYLVSLPLAYLSGIPVLWVVVFGGLFVALYTTLGGLEAVIWTDVLQTFVLLGGGLLCLGIIIYDLPGGLGEIVRIGVANDKFSLGPTEFNLSERTMWTMFLLGLVNFASDYVSNQTIVQRYLAARTEREAKQATLTCAFLSVPMWLLFFFVGTALYAYYQAFPNPELANLSSDEIVPFFILDAVPQGLTGIIIAGCIAAAMSTLDSSINGISTIATTDIVQRHLLPGADDAKLLRIAKLIAGAAGMMMIVGGVVLHFVPRESMANLGFIAGSLFGGCLLGLFLLGLLAPWADGRSVTISLGVVILLNIYFILLTLNLLPDWARTDLHAFWVRLLLNIVLVIVTAMVAALLGRKRPQRELSPELG